MGRVACHVIVTIGKVIRIILNFSISEPYFTSVFEPLAGFNVPERYLVQEHAVPGGQPVEEAGRQAIFKVFMIFSNSMPCSCIALLIYSAFVFVFRQGTKIKSCACTV